MKKIFGFFMVFAIISFLYSCSLLKKAPTTFIKTNEPGWSSIQIREGLKYEAAFQEVLDVVAKRFEMDMIAKEGGYGRSQWSYKWTSSENGDYRNRVIFKFSSDRTKVDIKTEAEYLKNGSWIQGYDTRVLETVKQDIMGVVSRVTL
jgi:hypothetical protein